MLADAWQIPGWSRGCRQTMLHGFAHRRRASVLMFFCFLRDMRSEDLFNKKLSRREFLKLAGITILSMYGIDVLSKENDIISL
jgi:hypothetical protein